MDNLTHGLLGLSIAASRKPDGGARLSATDKSVLLASVVAAELPDLDNFLPAANEVMHALHAHRGYSHSFLLAPVWALVATLLACVIFRGARWRPTFAFALAAVLFAHLGPDLWTGWGTRVLLPFSDARLSLDYTGVIDPFFTLPLVAALVWALVQRSRWRKALIVGLAISSTYLAFRIASREVLLDRVGSAYPTATRVEVFPALLSATHWRWAVESGEGFTVGRVPLFGDGREDHRYPRPPPLPPDLLENSTVREGLEWARLPLVSVVPLEGGEREVRIADLRYQLGGQPTLTVVVRVDGEGRTVDATLERGGSSAEILERWRQSR